MDVDGEVLTFVPQLVLPPSPSPFLPGGQSPSSWPAPFLPKRL